MRRVAASFVLIGAAAVSAELTKPTFEPSDVKGVFVEQFTEGWESRWKPSAATKKTPVGGEIFSYVGKWNVEESSVLPAIVGDKGLVAKSKAAHHAISAPFASPLNPKGQPLVVQYEAKFQKGGNCGGGYLKLLDSSLDPNEFSDKSPWVIMFGPDLTCPGTKVHFIFRHQNPISGEWEEKHLQGAPSPTIDNMTKLYTLIVNPDNTFKVLVDDEEASSGSLLENFSPAVNPPKEIDDIDDLKPSTWIDEPQMLDPVAKKPDDWDESQPFQVVDEDAIKPEDWLEDEATEIPDPEAEKPEEWDDEEDGDWVAPLIRNPKCEDAAGCGKWKKPMKANPLYVGIWEAPLVDNPDYKGPWSPRKIPNPSYFEDSSPANFNPIGGVGFEIWSMTEDILFDNVYVGHSADDAHKLAKETFHVKHAIEKEQRDTEKAAETAAADEVKPATTLIDTLQESFAALKENPTEYVREQVLSFVERVQEDGPVVALKAKPEVGGAILLALLSFFGAIGALFGIIGSTGTPVVKSSKKTDAPTADDKTATAKDAKLISSEPAKESKDTPVKKRK